MLCRSLSLVGVVALIAATIAPPHDTWLLTMEGPDRKVVGLSLRTGIAFPDSENAVAAENVTGWLVRPDGAREALLRFRADANTKATQHDLGALPPGVVVAVCDTAPKLLALEARKFNDYLLHEGLPKVLAARMDVHEEGRDATERYRKCAKVVFRTGAGEGRFAEPVGQALEIVPLEDPTLLEPRRTLRARVLFAGKPLAGALLGWDLPGNGEDISGSTWTNEAGEALVPIAQPGWMTLRLVHMTRPKAETHEYESYWASCSFVVPGPQ